MPTEPGATSRSFLLVGLALLLGGATSCGGPSTREAGLAALLEAQHDNEEIPLAAMGLKAEKLETPLDVQVDTYRIGANDVLNISVLGHDEVSSVRDFNRGIVGTIVKKDGQVHLPIVGPVPAAGLTIEEFADSLRAKLATYIKDPQMTVDVLRYESQKFFVLGEVSRPGAFPVDGDTTLLEGLGLAGGVSPEGNLDRAYVVRDGKLLPINLADLLLRGDTSRNIYMRHNDLVFVPPAGDQTVYVLGEVQRPGVVRIPGNRLTLAQALAQAGGLSSTEADDDNIRLIRGSWQEPTVYTFSYDELLAYGDRVLLAPGDRLVVEPTNLTSASRYMQQILPFLSGASSATSTTYYLQQISGVP